MAFYAIVANGIEYISSTWAKIEPLTRLYQNPKFKKFDTYAEATQFIKENKHKTIQYIEHYGVISNDYTIIFKYEFVDDDLLLVYNAQKLGEITILPPDGLDTTVYNNGNEVRLIIHHTSFNKNTLVGHFEAIKLGLLIAGPIVDIDVHISVFSVYYMFTLYKRESSRALSEFKHYLATRLGTVAYTHDWRRNGTTQSLSSIHTA